MHALAFKFANSGLAFEDSSHKCLCALANSHIRRLALACSLIQVCRLKSHIRRLLSHIRRLCSPICMLLHSQTSINTLSHLQTNTRFCIHRLCSRICRLCSYISTLSQSSLCCRFRNAASSAGVEEGVEFEMPVCVESFFGVDCTTKNHASALKLRTNACDDVQKATKQQKQGGGGCHFGCSHLSDLGFHHGKGAWKFAV